MTASALLSSSGSSRWMISRERVFFPTRGFPFFGPVFLEATSMVPFPKKGLCLI